MATVTLPVVFMLEPFLKKTYLTDNHLTIKLPIGVTTLLAQGRMLE